MKDTDPKIVARNLKEKFGKKAVSVVNEIMKYSPNKPSSEIDTIAFFMKVKIEIKELK